MHRIVKNALRLHEAMGKDLAALGGVLRCKECGEEMPIVGKDIASYLAQGWPRHCGKQMRWLTQSELEEETNG